MTQPETHTLDVPGAVLHYDVRSHDASTQSVLLLIASPMGRWIHHPGRAFRRPHSRHLRQEAVRRRGGRVPGVLAVHWAGANPGRAHRFPSYAAGCPTCSSIADSVNGVLPHLNARDVTTLFVSQAPLETLQAFKQRMGWSLPWVSSANSEFNIDLGFSSSQEQTRQWAEPMLEQLPPIAARNARETGTDIVGYLTENFGFSVFVLDDGAVYQTYSAGGRGVEFLMGYYPILDRAPKGRHEGDGFQLWIRRHDEYDNQ